jgi:nucleoside-triphosphatase
LPDGEVDGIVAHEIRVDGRRQGFGIRVLRSGETGVLASPDILSEIRFDTGEGDGQPRLGISHDFLDESAWETLASSDAALLVLDEIGPMQASSPRFRDVVNSLLEQNRHVVGSIAIADDDWLDHVRAHPSVAVIELSRTNRDVVTEALTAYFRDLLRDRSAEADDFS